MGFVIPQNASKFLIEPLKVVISTKILVMIFIRLPAQNGRTTILLLKNCSFLLPIFIRSRMGWIFILKVIKLALKKKLIMKKYICTIANFNTGLLEKPEEMRVNATTGLHVYSSPKAFYESCLHFSPPAESRISKFCYFNFSVCLTYVLHWLHQNYSK